MAVVVLKLVSQGPVPARCQRTFLQPSFLRGAVRDLLISLNLALLLMLLLISWEIEKMSSSSGLVECHRSPHSFVALFMTRPTHKC